MMKDPRTHWQHVHQAGDTTSFSWYEEVPSRSLELIRAARTPRDAPVIDVGGGASKLVDHLLQEGFTDITVLDIAPAALEIAKDRLGAAAEGVHWIDTDISSFRPARHYSMWHDRAVFHFLVDPLERTRYIDALRDGLSAQGNLVLATFGPAGPTRCSGLGVERYSAADLTSLIGPEFRLMRSHLDEHPTPDGQKQQLLYGWWWRVDY